MGNNESKVMKDLHYIREKNYKETKYMTFKELAESINKEAERIDKEHKNKTTSTK